ncbi:Ankyrin repeat domain containing protein [Echinococcus multilocularis]|uniref:Ankyrin repeat domain containing protein n=1 Tax=Echinococcus multilocularis TaxID=6211 RepID=A0A068XYU8_ECHMU|nr:Ankyrin repeat domain containing protein [Echinococcus multilocularis]
MDSMLQSAVIRNPLSPTVRAQECISYIHDDDANLHPTESHFQHQVRTSASSDPSSHQQRLSLHVDTPDEFTTESYRQNGFYEGNVAYVKPFTHHVISPIARPVKFQSNQDEFLIYGTSRRLRSEFYDEVSKKEELRLREQKIAEREAQLQQRLAEEEEKRRIEPVELMGRMGETAYIDDVGDVYDEEIIEDTITTRRKPQIQAEIAPINYQAPVPTKVTHSVGVGDSDVNQYFLLDTGSRSVNPADFPPIYWERLSRYFTEEIKRKRPTCRDASSQLTPPKQRTVSQAAYVEGSPPLRNFGVCVKPIAFTRGCTTDPAHSSDKRNSACMTDDLDEYFARLLRSICTEYPNADRTFIKSLYRYSRTDISLFIRRLVERLEELRQAEATRVPPIVAEAPPKPQMFSVGLDARPLMLNKRTASEPPRRNLGTNTDLVIRRSQGISHTPSPTDKSPVTSDFSGSTGCFFRRVDTGSQATLTEPRAFSPPPPTSRSSTTTETASRRVTTYRIKRIAGHVDKEGKVSSKTFETSGEGKPPPSALIDSLSAVLKDSKKFQEEVPTQPSLTSDSQKRYMSENVMVETWFEKEVPKRSMSPLPRGSSPKAAISPLLPSERPQLSFSRTVEVGRSPTFTPPEDFDSISTLHHQQFRRTPVARTMSPASGITAAYRANSPNIPLRNYTYKVTAEMRKAVEALSGFYLSSSGGTLTDDMQEYLDIVRKSWFDMVSQTHIDLEQIEDLFAFLYNSAPQLLYLFVRMPTTRGSTCLHYAVGHGAWRVVSLILNTGYADANKKNSFGFSSIMIAAISDSIDSSAIPVLERLLAAGDVNARAGTAPGQTPLMLAARKANTTVVELLLRHGADVNAQDDIGNTALMCAIDCGNLDMVKLLITRPELNVDLKDQEGSTALSIAEAGGNEEIIRLMRERSAIFKSDLTYHITSTSRQLFEPRNLNCVNSSSNAGGNSSNSNDFNHSNQRNQYPLHTTRGLVAAISNAVFTFILHITSSARIRIVSFSPSCSASPFSLSVSILHTFSAVI